MRFLYTAFLSFDIAIELGQVPACLLVLALGAIGLYSPTRRAQVYEPEAGPEAALGFFPCAL